jgi:SH3 domain protein
MAILRIFLLALFLNTPPIVQADTATRFISQSGPAELRTGLAKKDKTIKTLEPGTEIKLLKLNPKLGYAKVQLTSGESGWIASRTMTTEAPIAQPDTASPQLTATEAPEKTPQQLQAELKRLETELIAVRQASANVLRIQAERDQLQESVIAQRKELEAALRDKNALTDDQKQAWFLIGGGVLFAGIFLGVFLPRLSVRRRGQWNSF